jgi:hypothetical protein
MTYRKKAAFNRAHRVPYSLLVLLSVLLATTGCTSTGHEQAVRQFLGLEQTFPHNDIPPPPTPAGFAMLLGLGQTQRITVRDLAGNQEQHITDAQAVAQVIAVLRRGAQAQPRTTEAHTPTETLQLHLTLGPPQREVTVVYKPSNGSLVLFNVPVAAWPDHVVGTYTVPDSFGAALTEALATATP